MGCIICRRYFHVSCIAKWQRQGYALASLRKEFICGVCRLEELDPFHKVLQTLAGPVVCDSRRQSDRVIKLSVTLPPEIKGLEVQLRAIALDGAAFTGPAWPHFLEAFINSKKSFKIDPPKYLHTRREQNHDLTNLLQGGRKTEIELRSTFDAKQATSPDMPKAYLIGCFLTKPVPTEELLKTITSGIQAPPDRYKRVLEKLSEATDDVACVSHAHGRTMAFVDPVSHCRIETPCIGVNCVHLQTFDIDSYLHVNAQTRNLSTRWHCPVCNMVLLPSDLVVDTFMANILAKHEGLGQVVIKDDGSCEVILEEEADVHDIGTESEGENGEPQEGEEDGDEAPKETAAESAKENDVETPQTAETPPGANKLPVHALPRKQTAAKAGAPRLNSPTASASPDVDSGGNSVAAKRQKTGKPTRPIENIELD